MLKQEKDSPQEEATEEVAGFLVGEELVSAVVISILRCEYALDEGLYGRLNVLFDNLGSKLEATKRRHHETIGNTKLS